MRHLPIAQYAARTKDRILLEASTSGGVFTELARRVIAAHGIVFGAAFEPQTFRVVHLPAENEGELQRLRGSKYSMSDMSGAFARVRDALSAGRQVLFTGSPCQTAAMRKVFGDDPNLILCAVMCRNNVDPELWASYLSELQGKFGHAVSAVAFRDKRKKGWRRSRVLISFAGTDQVLDESKHRNAYMRAFALAPRDVCTRCAFRAGNGGADLMIGDFWGVDRVAPGLDDGRGCSIVLIYTERGRRLFESLDLESRPVTYEQALVHNRYVEAQYVPDSEKRRKFLSLRATFGITDAVRQVEAEVVNEAVPEFPASVRPKVRPAEKGRGAMRIAVLTFHRSRNCGAMLQAWALKRVLEGMGHSVTFCRALRRRYSCWQPLINPELHGRERVSYAWTRLLDNLRDIRFSRRHYGGFETFANRCLLDSSKDLSTYDAVVVGSDQVWSPRLAHNRWPLLTGQTVAEGVRMISYAASCGDSLPKEELFGELRTALGRFSRISVREAFLRKEIEKWGYPAALVADPTLLLCARDYKRIADNELVPNVPYHMVFYANRESEFAQKVARFLRRNSGLKTLLIPGRTRIQRDEVPKHALLGVSPDRFLGLVAQAQGVVASSFHATVFALIFGKPFVSLCRSRTRKRMRVGELLRMLGLDDRLVSPKTPREEILRLLTTPLPESVRERLEALRENSRDWLVEALADETGDGGPKDEPRQET